MLTTDKAQAPGQRVETCTEEQLAILTNLRSAAQVGIADIEAGAFRTFASADALSAHLAAIAEVAINHDLSDDTD